MIRFMRLRLVYFTLSALVILSGVFAFLKWGVNVSIDFTGGSVLQFTINQNYKKQVSVDSIKQVAKELGIQSVQVHQLKNGDYLIKSKPFDQEKNTLLQQKLASSSGVATVSAFLNEKKFETLGPTFGAETLKKTIIAISLAALVILLFVWKEFKDKKYGISAIIAMFHDTLVTFSLYVWASHLYGAEIDTLFMTALLTILSFSVHDTIVVYDRIRESKKNLPGVKYENLVDKALNETMGRSVNNSLTIIFMLAVLFLMGGETIKWFVFTLLVGTISGTYSSPFIASPLLLVWDQLFAKKH